MSQGRYHWSWCANRARFFVIDALAFIPWVILALHPSFSVFLIAVAITVALAFIELYLKLSLNAAWNAFLVFLTGKHKPTGKMFTDS